MVRRQVTELICDECGYIERFETSTNASTPLTVTLNVSSVIAPHGWTEQAVEGASWFRNRDICKACQPKKDRKATSKKIDSGMERPST
jgi:hypothetical protein